MRLRQGNRHRVEIIAEENATMIKRMPEHARGYQELWRLTRTTFIEKFKFPHPMSPANPATIDEGPVTAMTRRNRQSMPFGMSDCSMDPAAEKLMTRCERWQKRNATRCRVLISRPIGAMPVNRQYGVVLVAGALNGNIRMQRSTPRDHGNRQEDLLIHPLWDA